MSHPETLSRLEGSLASNSWDGSIPRLAERRPASPDPSLDRRRTRARIDGPDYHTRASHTDDPNRDLSSLPPTSSAPVTPALAQTNIQPAPYRVVPNPGNSGYTFHSSPFGAFYIRDNGTVTYPPSLYRPPPPGFLNPASAHTPPSENQNTPQSSGTSAEPTSYEDDRRATLTAAGVAPGDNNGGAPIFD